MKDNSVQFMAPLAQLESLTDTIIQSENNEVVAIAETGGLNLCCCSRRTSEPLIINFTDENKQLHFAETPQCNDKTMQGFVTASATATSIATQYVGDNVQKDPTEMKKSRIHRFLERTTKKHDKSRTLGPELDYDVDSEASKVLEENKSVKTSRRKDVLRRLKKQEKDESSFSEAPTTEDTKRILDSRRQTLTVEPSDTSNVTGLSMDCVQIIETEYPEYTNIYSSGDDNDEVSFTLVYVIGVEIF